MPIKLKHSFIKTISFFGILFPFFGILNVSAQVQVRREMNLMHSPSSVIVVEKDSATANAMIDMVVDEFQRIEDKISEWDPKSEVSQINANAGIKPVKVTKEVYDFLKRSQMISQLTEGAFDLSWASLGKAWKFDGTQEEIPSQEEIKQSIALINYKDIIFDDVAQTVFLKNKGMKIGTGGNGQGFGVDKAVALLKEKGVKNALVNASGDIYAYGKQADGNEWKIGISNPLDKHKVFAYLQLNEMALTTAGNYEKYILYNGEKYSHIIDPRTGYPARGVQSVSVYSKSAELSDALDTSLFIL